MGGANSYDGEKAWSSIANSIFFCANMIEPILSLTLSDPSLKIHVEKNEDYLSCTLLRFSFPSPLDVNCK
jgi:hypothetical protein